MYNTRFKGSFKAVPIYVYKPRSIRKQTLGSISCNTTTSRPLRLIPLNWVPLELLQDSDSLQSYSSSLEFVLPRIPVSRPRQRRTTKSSLGQTKRPSPQPDQKTLKAEGTIPRSMPRTQPKDDSSWVKPRSIVLWQPITNQALSKSV